MQMDVPEDIKEAVEVINDGAKRVARIVEKLLTFARRNRPDKEYVDINAIVTNTVEMRSYEMRNNNIEVTTQLAADLPRTMANIGQLQQVFLNIIINAEQAMTSVDKMGKLFIKTAETYSLYQKYSRSGNAVSEPMVKSSFLQQLEGKEYFVRKGTMRINGKACNCICLDLSAMPDYIEADFPV